MKLVSSAFGYWSDGNHHHKINPPLANPENAIPFVVRYRGKGYIDINVIVWAETPEDAVQRIMAAIIACEKGDYGSERNRARKLREQIENGELTLEVEKYDINVIANVQWADNDGILT